MNAIQIILLSNLTCALVSAKWALDLKYIPSRQILFGVGGLIFGPLMLLILYAIHVHKEFPHALEHRHDFPIPPITPII